jgi:uncharacterized protein YbjT (DUF2867 family)
VVIAGGHGKKALRLERLLADRGDTPVGSGAVPRDDVAAVLLALLDRPDSSGPTLELVGGGTPIPAALA